jgi:uncharacterized membrane protein
MIDLSHWFDIWQSTSMLIAQAAFISLTAYWLINRYHSWTEIKKLSYWVSLVFYAMLVLQLPHKFEQNLTWTTVEWLVFAVLIIGWLSIGQLWLKTWHADNDTDIKTPRYADAIWLGTGLLLIAAAAHYGLPDSEGVMTILIPTCLVISGLWFSYRLVRSRQQGAQVQNTSTRLLPWFDWQQALINCASVFTPIALLWVIITNWSYDGVIWGLPYFPVLNLYDVTSSLVLLTGFGLYYMSQKYDATKPNSSSADLKFKKVNTTDDLLIVLGLISFWFISSMLIRTLHAFIGAPLWEAGAWQSEQVQTGLTILWTLLALIATIIASRYWQRALWFMGIGLLGIVVLKLVLVDLSQTEAIWRVISFLGAGSLILLIGYLAPLPPAIEESIDKPQK